MGGGGGHKEESKELLPAGEGMEPVEDTIHRTPEFEPEAVNKDAQGLSMAPRMGEPIDLKPKTEEIDQSRKSPCAATLKEKLSLKEDEIFKSETSSKEESKKREERKENEKKFKRDGERNDKERKEEAKIK